MASLLDQETHLKSGRAVVFLSISILLLNRCADEFDHLELLNIPVAISRTQLLDIFLYALIYSLLLFVFRVYQAAPLLEYRRRFSEAEEKSRRRLQELTLSANEKANAVKNDGLPTAKSEKIQKRILVWQHSQEVLVRRRNRIDPFISTAIYWALEIFLPFVIAFSVLTNNWLAERVCVEPILEPRVVISIAHPLAETE